jgi:hypothetical protein
MGGEGEAGDRRNCQNRVIAEIENQNPGVESCKPFRILVKDRGGGEEILGIPYGCPITTIDCGPVPAAAVAINTEVKLLAVIFAWNAATLFDPLLAT